MHSFVQGVFLTVCRVKVSASSSQEWFHGQRRVHPPNQSYYSVFLANESLDSSMTLDYSTSNRCLQFPPYCIWRNYCLHLPTSLATNDDDDVFAHALSITIQYSTSSLITNYLCTVSLSDLTLLSWGLEVRLAGTHQTICWYMPLRATINFFSSLVWLYAAIIGFRERFVN